MKLSPEVERRAYARLLGPAVSTMTALYVLLAIGAALLFEAWLIPAIMLGVPAFVVVSIGASRVARPGDGS